MERRKVEGERGEKKERNKERKKERKKENKKEERCMRTMIAIALSHILTSR